MIVDKEVIKVRTAENLQEILQRSVTYHWVGDVDETHYEKWFGVLEDFRSKIGSWPQRFTLVVANSGGNGNSALAFYEFVRLSGLNLTTVATTNVESAAMLLFLAGKERYAARRASFLIHNPIRDHESLSPDNTKQKSAEIDSFYQRYVAVIAEATGLTPERVRRIAKGAYPISVQQAKKLGIVHHIV